MVNIKNYYHRNQDYQELSRIFSVFLWLISYTRVYACALQEAKTQTQAMTKSPVVSSQVQIKSKDEAPVIKNNLAEPEYDFLSKQPTEIVDETYKVDKFEKRKKIHENFYTILYINIYIIL